MRSEILTSRILSRIISTYKTIGGFKFIRISGGKSLQIYNIFRQSTFFLIFFTKLIDSDFSILILL
jgi:hypothetical protein